MGSETYHEPYEQLSRSTRDMHRALVSLIEEIEAIDWYAQRAEVTTDAELRSVLLHNRGEEIEHAIMNLEWIRRNDPKFDETIRTYLLTDVPIVEIEERSQDKRSAGPTSPETNATVREARGAEGGPKPQMFNLGFGAQGAEGGPKPQMFNLGIGSLKGR